MWKTPKSKLESFVQRYSFQSGQLRYLKMQFVLLRKILNKIFHFFEVISLKSLAKSN